MVARFTELLLDWYGENRRDLPWRRDPSPWRVLVAETMLQQTRVATVLPRYEEFLARFPTPAAMAAADEDEVLALWSGLGYYRRARNLHAAAQVVTERFDGEVPGDPGRIRELPGVGDYTAGAILSIAFGKPEPIVDGNVGRLLSRVFLIRGPIKRGEAKKRLWTLAREIVANGPPDRVNQALMEFGGLVCRPKNPVCGECPMSLICSARAEGAQEDLPELPAPRKTIDVTLAVGLVRRGDRTLLVRAPEGGFLAGTWAPPFARVPEGADPQVALRHLRLEPTRLLGTVRHTITHHRIAARCYASRLTDGDLNGDALFLTEEDLADYGVSALARKALAIKADPSDRE